MFTGDDSRNANKQNILESFPSKNDTFWTLQKCRVLCSRDWQGRQGWAQSVAYGLHNVVMLNHVDIHMKSFIKTKECRRKTLLSHFESVSMYPEQPHLCCDNCGTQCKCGMLHSDNITKDPFTTYKDTLPTSTEREVSQQQLKVVEENLIKYHKSTVMQLVGTTASGNVKT